ncbi:hypothetical protein ACFWIX_10500 [Pseudarthrobacter sp. NPDC058362]|uniref:hypothetical protein n=1 Tax=Pseudarthrobacter sp. NPDC058362 TaxID=3346458 RepID=UPI0036492EDA
MDIIAVYSSNFALSRELWAALHTSVIRDNALVHDDPDISYRPAAGHEPPLRRRRDRLLWRRGRHSSC